MSITYPLTLPTGAIRHTRFRPFAVVGESRSPFTLQSQVQSHAGQLWVVDVTLKPMQRAEADDWIATLIALNGKQGTFLLGDVAKPAPRGTPGSPLVKGAGQSGLTLTIDNMTPSATGVFLKGDWIQLGGYGSPAQPQRLYMNLNDVDADVNGEAILDIWPRLRESPADNEPVVTSNTKGTFALESNEMPWEINEALIYGLDFGAVEAVRS